MGTSHPTASDLQSEIGWSNASNKYGNQAGQVNQTGQETLSYYPDHNYEVCSSLP